jgi:hypothetical protein
MGSAALPPSNLRLAGVTIMLVATLCTLAGVGIGHLAGSTAVGGFAGAIISVPVAGLVMYRLLVKPFQEESAKRDYSHLSQRVDDD